LYFCDVALLVTLVGIWTESAFLISTQAVGILLPQTLWVFDFVSRATLGVHITGMTEYMFNPHLPLFVRALSSFHGWLPLVLIWLLMRLGYDRRAFRVQVPFVILLLLACYFFAPVVPPAAHPGYAANINYVHGMDDLHPQTKMAPAFWLLLMMAVNVIGFHTPTHFALARVFRRAADSGKSSRQEPAPRPDCRQVARSR
jgi:hypothetical protein